MSNFTLENDEHIFVYNLNIIHKATKLNIRNTAIISSTKLVLC